MSRKKNDDELRESLSDEDVEKAVVEFVQRLDNLDSELAGLREDRKDLIEEYKSKIDVKTLNQVLRVMKIKKNVAHRDTYDTYEKALEKLEP